jgi:hypothetical protein
MVDLDFLHSIDLQKNLQVQVYNFMMLELLVAYWPTLLVFLHTHPRTLQIHL